MAEATLLEDIIVHILTWLPVKSLVRFTCVSKHFHSIILSDAKFAKSQFQAARERNILTHRLLYPNKNQLSEFESLDLETALPSCGNHSSVRKLKLPFQPPAGCVSVLGSCNGIVFLAFDERIYYMWNPFTGSFKKLPDLEFQKEKYVRLPWLEFPQKEKQYVEFYGVGYLPATDDFVILVVSGCYFDDKYDAAVFSSRANAWKIHEIDLGRNFFTLYDQGTLLKDALHWPHNDHKTILAFDLTQQEGRHKFRKMLLPRDFDFKNRDDYFGLVGVSAGGCLSVARSLSAAQVCIEVWIMREYDVRDSWTKLFNLKISDPPKGRYWHYIYNRGFLMETGMLALMDFPDDMGYVLAKILYKEDECSFLRVHGLVDIHHMIQYQESLLRIDD